MRAFRSGLDFTEQEVFLLTLLKPHVEIALTRSLAATRATPRLTRRQLQVLRMVQAGLTNRQIARRTGLTEGTVHTHLTHIYTRLGVQSRTAAVHMVFDTADAWPTDDTSSRGPGVDQAAATASTSATG